MNRRTAIKLFLASSVSINVLINACAAMQKTRIRGDLGKLIKGFNAYNGKNPNLHSPDYCIETYYDNIIQHKPTWGGTQYRLKRDYPIVASAAGIAKWTHMDGYHGWEDILKIDHGGITTVYAHMKFKSVPFTTGTSVKRGDLIGLADNRGGFYLKTHMWRAGIRDDLDYYGEEGTYMQYWDGRPLDMDFDEVRRKDRLQVNLINQFKELYKGPGAEQLKDVWSYNGMPKILMHPKSSGDVMETWSYPMLYKLMNHLYETLPQHFSAPKNEIHGLITDIKKNQPVVLTLPFRKH
jgi:hypothetical protein